MPRFAVLLMLAAAACAPRPDLEAERLAIVAADSAWLAAAQSRNVNATVAFWTPDAQVFGAAQRPVVGEDAIKRMVSEGFATPGFSVTWTTTNVIVGPTGGMAYSYGPNRFTMPAGAGRVDTLRGNSVVVWRKTADGQWRAAVDIWTPEAASADSAPARAARRG